MISRGNACVNAMAWKRLRAEGLQKAETGTTVPLSEEGETHFPVVYKRSSPVSCFIMSYIRKRCIIIKIPENVFSFFLKEEGEGGSGPGKKYACFLTVLTGCCSLCVRLVHVC